MIPFLERTQTKKGDLGERLVDELLFKKGYVIYKPINIDMPHVFDRLCIKDKEVAIIAEVKTKAKRKYYNDTGINYKHYKEYKKMLELYNLDTVLFFVDEEQGYIYSQKLSKLDEIESFDFKGKEVTYPLIQKGVIYFWFDKLIKLTKLPEESITELKELTTKNDTYLPENRNNLPTETQRQNEIQELERNTESSS